MLLRTALLNALHSRARNRPVHSLRSILDGLDGALARNGCGAEEAGLAGNLLAEHVGCVCGGRVDVFLWEADRGAWIEWWMGFFGLREEEL